MGVRVLPTCTKREFHVSVSQKILLGASVYMWVSDYNVMSHFVFLKVCDTADRLRDTLIHEMCHAAVWILNGVKNGHGQIWNAWYVHIIHYTYCILSIFMWDIPVCGEYKTGTINRQSHTE